MERTPQRFWQAETRDEMNLIDMLLRRRFGALPQSISEVLDRHDPLDIVYPENPGEYVDVVREFLVRAYGETLSVDRVVGALTVSFAACFDDEVERSDVDAISTDLMLLDLKQLRNG